MEVRRQKIKSAASFGIITRPTGTLLKEEGTGNLLARICVFMSRTVLGYVRQKKMRSLPLEEGGRRRRTDDGMRRRRIIP